MIVFGTTVEIANSDDRADPQDRAARDDPPPTPPAAGDRANVRLRAGQSAKPFLTTSEIRADPRSDGDDLTDPRFYKFLK